MRSNQLSYTATSEKSSSRSQDNFSLRAPCRNRSGDLVLTKNALYRLSYEGSRKRDLFKIQMDGEGYEPPKASAN